MANGGEVGSIVLYVCTSRHNTTAAVCSPGDVHPAIVAEVLARDAVGRPTQALLAIFVPYQPSIQWLAAPRAARTVGAGDTVWRIARGAPPAEAARNPGNSIEHRLDFPVNSWFLPGE